VHGVWIGLVVAAHESADARSSELRLFLEEVLCDLCRYRHVADGIRPEDVRIQQEVYLGRLGAFADIKVTVPGSAPYFVEVKYGYPPEKVVRHLERKFGAATPGGREAAKLVLVIDAASSGDWPATERNPPQHSHGACPRDLGRINAAVAHSLTVRPLDRSAE
jgi:hypothetical protein